MQPFMLSFQETREPTLFLSPEFACARMRPARLHTGRRPPPPLLRRTTRLGAYKPPPTSGELGEGTKVGQTTPFKENYG